MVAEQVAKYVDAKGIKQKAVAEAIGITPQAMSATLAGKRTLSADEYHDICDFLEVPYAKFMEPLGLFEQVA